MRKTLSQREGGFSLIEILIGAAILLTIAVGIVPLFMNAMQSNLSGREATEVSNFAISRLEEFLQLDFNSNKLSLDYAEDGVIESDDLGPKKVIREYLWEPQQKWVECAPGETCPPDDRKQEVHWQRITEVRQYGLQLGGNERTVLEGPLPEGTPRDAISVKRIDVIIERPRTGGPLGPGQEISVQVWKAS